MKKTTLLLSCIVITARCFSQTTSSDQNPDYAISKAKYIATKDSLIRFESTTENNTYKACDYFADKQERKDAKAAFKRQLKLQKAQSRLTQQLPYYPGYPYYSNSFGNNFLGFFNTALPWVGGYLMGKY